MRAAERCDGNHGAAGSAYKKQVEIVAPGSVRSLRLDINSVYAVEHIEVVDIYGTRECFHGGKYIRHIDPLQLRLVTVNVKIQLRYVALHRCGQSAYFRCRRSIMYQSVYRILEFLVRSAATRLKHHFKAAGSTKPGYNCRSGKIYTAFRIRRQLCHGFLHQSGKIAVAAFVPRFQNHSQLAVCLIRAYSRRCSGYSEYMLHIRLCH